ncbi:diguanylate cyclase [Bosea sp. RAF48]|uniref:sensor domain-containing diguanylate cyclase n=1 Tax=Bosea sp. RAF48 TaxID=3237480 RepID=UPI003F92760A
MNSQQLIAATRPLYDRAAATASIGAWECNLSNESLSWTDGVYDLFGLKRGSAIYRSATLDLYEDQSRRDMNRLRSTAIRTGQGFALDCRIKAATGERRWMRLVVGVGHQHGRPLRIFGSKQDVTAEKGLWTELAGTARSEPLTGHALPHSFADTLRQIRHDRRSGPDRFALAIFQIDRFQNLVEDFGKAASDTLTRGIAERLKRLFPDALAIDPAGPGAFALLLQMPGDRHYLGTVLDGTRRLLCRPVSHGALVLDFKLSIGAALVMADRFRQQQEILAEAEAALHVAGMAGGDCVRVFDGPVTAIRSRAASA